jgi:3',5'-cyclic AMP phosphodiesterase CpdA
LQSALFAPRDAAPGLQRFAVIGDPGSGTKHQWKIAEQMAKQYSNTPFASVLVLGDNVYEDGEPHLFKERIADPYAPLLKAGVRFYPVMGNHDVRKGFGDQQLAYWGAPPYYQLKLGKDLELFAIDTTVYLPGYDTCYTDNPFLALKKAEVQTQWLEKALADSQAKYKVVFGHYPLYSSGKHSTEPESMIKLRTLLEPIFTRHGVDLYLAGHEHHYEKSHPINNLLHIVTGSAGRLRDIFYKENPPHPRDVAIAKYQFMLFELTDQGLRYQTLSKKGKVLDSGMVSSNRDRARLVQFA